LVRNLRLVGLLGCPTGDRRLEFPLSTKDRAEAADLLRPVRRERGPLVGLHTGARAPSRRWPPEYFAAVACYLAQRWAAQVVLTGGRDDAEQARAVARHLSTPLLDLVGQTSLGGLGAVIDACDLFISNDTGPAHVAVAVDTPSVTIFGPVDPVRWAPLDRARHPIARHPVACSPCGHAICPIDHRCLRGLRPATVIALADSLLQREAVACAV
jgi:ADP-heptose:LPS heptosyltransferase